MHHESDAGSTSGLSSARRMAHHASMTESDRRPRSPLPLRLLAVAAFCALLGAPVVAAFAASPDPSAPTGPSQANPSGDPDKGPGHGMGWGMGHGMGAFGGFGGSKLGDTGGAGLGLAIVEKAMHRMGGEVEFHNAPDGGLIAHIRLKKAP